jgi:excisionase family DNA binding protein
MPVSELLTVEEVAEYLRVSIYTVREMIKSGKLPGVKLGKSYRIKRADVERLVNTEAKQ